MSVTTVRKSPLDRIAMFLPCEDGQAWLSGYTNAQKAWDECPKGNWLTWLIEKAGLSKSKRFKACCLELCYLSVRYCVNETTKAGLRKALKKWEQGESISQKDTDFNTDFSAQLAVDDLIQQDSCPGWSLAANAEDQLFRYLNGSTMTVTEIRKRVNRRVANIVRKHFPKPPRIKAA